MTTLMWLRALGNWQYSLAYLSDNQDWGQAKTT